MKKLYLLLFFSTFLLCLNFKLESRQYNIDYLIDLIEAGNEEGVKHFFSQPKYATKLRHIVEFSELFREKLEERFGYKPSYREAYDFLKNYLRTIDFTEENKNQLLAIFKEVVKQSEKAEKSGHKLDSVTMDFKGSKDSDFDLPDPIVIAYQEAIGGGLMCIVPGGISQGIGILMLSDACRRTFNYLSEKNAEKPISITEKDYNKSNFDTEYERENDRDSWDREY